MCLKAHRSMVQKKKQPRFLAQGTVCHSPYRQPTIFSFSYFVVNSLDQLWPFLMHIFCSPLASGAGRRKGDQLWAGVFQLHRPGINIPGHQECLQTHRQDCLPFVLLGCGAAAQGTCWSRSTAPFSLLSGSEGKESCTAGARCSSCAWSVAARAHQPATAVGVRAPTQARCPSGNVGLRRREGGGGEWGLHRFWMFHRSDHVCGVVFFFFSCWKEQWSWGK